MEFFFKSLAFTLIISMCICMCVCRPRMETRPRSNHGNDQAPQGMKNMKDLMVEYVVNGVEKDVQQEKASIVATAATTPPAATTTTTTATTAASETMSSLSNALRFRRNTEHSCVKSHSMKFNVKVVECHISSPVGQCTKNILTNGSTLCKPVVETIHGKKFTIDCTCA